MSNGLLSSSFLSPFCNYLDPASSTRPSMQKGNTIAGDPQFSPLLLCLRMLENQYHEGVISLFPVPDFPAHHVGWIKGLMIDRGAQSLCLLPALSCPHDVNLSTIINDLPHMAQSVTHFHIGLESLSFNFWKTTNFRKSEFD